MSPGLKVFLSSTSIDLTPHRAKVRDIVDRLSQVSVCMETFGARPTSPLETCRQAVQRADALVVLVGHRYGWIPSTDEGGDGEKSITWWEVQWARDAGKPVYAYLVDPLAPWPGEREQDRLLQATSAEARDEVGRAVASLLAFREFLDTKTTRELFTSSDDLGGKVATSLHHWLLAEHMKIAPTSGGSTSTSPPSGAAFPNRNQSPFPGLRAYTPDDAPMFFGRDRERISWWRG